MKDEQSKVIKSLESRITKLEETVNSQSHAILQITQNVAKIAKILSMAAKQ